MADALYVHIPFCDAICAYCDFFRCGYHRQLSDQYLEALAMDLKKQQVIHSLQTIYIGGGTPSSLKVDQMKRLFEMLEPYATEQEEYTVEVNVESLDDEKISCMCTAGVNRISMGVQSFQPELLSMMNRTHRKGDVITAIQKLCNAGITNISIDLIYGLPNQTLADWIMDLNEAVKLPITHLSIYALTIEEHSAFGRKGVTNIDPTLEGEMYDMAISIMQKHGYHQYEISSFAKTGYESLHNKKYWHYDDFYGVGSGASGKINHQRYDMPRNLHDYIQGRQDPEFTPLTKEDEMFEMLMMGLRLREGLSYKRFNDIFHESFDDVFGEAKQRQVANGNLFENGKTLCASDHGFHFLNDVLIEFL